MRLGSAIKTIRTNLGITQIELSERTGISQTSLSKIEGGTNPNSGNLKKICAALDVPPSLVYMLSIDEGDVPANKKTKFKMLFPVLENIVLEIIGGKEAKPKVAKK